MKAPRPNAPLTILTGNGRDAVRRRPGGRSTREQIAVFEAAIQLIEKKGADQLTPCTTTLLLDVR
jgi:hypothetical protein